MIEMPITLEPYESYCNRLIEETHKMVKEMHDIVYCKDCKYWDETYFYHSEDDAMQRCICRKHNNIFMTADDFCSRGEKR